MVGVCPLLASRPKTSVASVMVARLLERRRMRPIRSFALLLMTALLAAGVPTVSARAAGATSPSARYRMGMAYDQARGEVVLFGGNGATGDVGDTWTWDGTTWTQQHPATSPSARYGMGMAYD